ncbi:response regulator [Pseudomethylobacillus aquaticus]|uniref:histidine kinase n=1 Tax=Pseudomethylobacillus aquaticus TaxID=2676064 RepID=A0A3N0UVJ9_9PROT|nr:ATP-binding protein [Pseudomethylobacillus aquaticus]ROH84540.1 response regulator [Pseudomethylobacillus aquaticus]
MSEQTITNRQRAEIIHEFLQLAAKQNLRTSIGSFTAIAVLTAIAFNQADQLPAKLWLALALIGQILRISIIYLPRLKVRINILATMRVYQLVAGLVGLIFGAFLMFFPALSEIERSIVTVIFLGLCSGSVANTPGQRAVFMLFATPILVGLSLAWGLTEIANYPEWISLAMVGLILLYTFMLFEMSKNSWQLIQEGYQLRFRDQQQKRLLLQALKEAEDANRSKTRFLAAASHDLRQPLHTISLVSATLGLHHLGEESQRLVKILNEVSMSLSSQLNDLLDISKLDAGIVEAHVQATNISAILSNIYAEFELSIADKGLKTTVNLSSNTKSLTDPQLIHRIFRNLLHNAIKFTDEGSISIDVYDAPSGRHVCVAISDTGRGIALEHQQEIFQEFYQVDNANRDRSQGFGLGLSIVKRLADLLQIKLEMESIPEKGTRFTLSIPVEPDQSASSDENHHSKDDTTLFDLRVLVVDDEEIIRTATELLLETLGCECMSAASSLAALQIATHWKPDIMLADFRLSDGDTGINAAKSLRTLYPDLPIMLISGDTAPDLLQTIRASGFKLLHKPLSLGSLRAELHAAKEHKSTKKIK